MTSSSLVGFLVELVALFGVGAIFMLTIDSVAKQPVLAKIAKIAVGCLILIAFILAVAAVLGFGGAGATVSPYGIIVFAVGVLVLLLVLYLVDLFIGWLGPLIGPPAAQAVQYVIAVLALIALLVVAGDALIGGGALLGAHGFRR